MLGWRDCRRMTPLRVLHLELDLRPGAEPMAGQLRSEGGAVEEFTGVLELIGLIDAKLADAEAR